MRNNSKETLYLWDTINGGMEEFDSLEDLREYVLECYAHTGEGVHPDIENLQIFKAVGGVVLKETGQTAELDGEEVPVVKVLIVLNGESTVHGSDTTKAS